MMQLNSTFSDLELNSTSEQRYLRNAVLRRMRAPVALARAALRPPRTRPPRTRPSQSPVPSCVFSARWCAIVAITATAATPPPLPPAPCHCRCRAHHHRRLACRRRRRARRRRRRCRRVWVCVCVRMSAYECVRMSACVCACVFVCSSCSRARSLAELAARAHAPRLARSRTFTCTRSRSRVRTVTLPCHRRSVCGHYRDALPVSSTKNARRSKVHTHHACEECERGRAVLCVVIAAAATACAVERVMREHEKLDVNDTNGLCTVRARSSSQFDRRARRDSALGLAGAAARTRPRMPGAVSAPKTGPCRYLAGLQNRGPTRDKRLEI